MSALSKDRAGIVKALIEAAPDSAIRSLEVALSGDIAGGSLAAVKSIVDAEVYDRLVRDTVFDPIAPLFSPRSDSLEQLLFPRIAYGRLWRALKAARPEACAEAAVSPLRPVDGEAAPTIFDELCRLAAGLVRSREGDFAPLAELLDGFRPGAAAELVASLELCPIAREALRQLPGWLARMTDERQAAARLMYKDAVAVAEDDGPRLMEILFARLAEPWTILRILSAVMLKPDDRYAASSELADFGARLLRDIDRRIEFVRGFDYNGGPATGEEAARALRIASAIAAEFEQSLVLTREGPWGQKLAKQKQSMAAAAEAHLRKVEKIVAEALPMQPVRLGGRTLRTEPRLDAPPNAAPVTRAQSLLTFFAGMRTTAAQCGYGTARAKVCEAVAHYLDGYVEELLSTLRSNDCEFMDNAALYLETSADLSALVHDDQTAQIIRRRAAAA